MFFYGGAWRQGDKADYLFLGQALASRGIGVVVADYRLFPNVRYPAFIQDGALAVGWSARRFGSARLFLMGHSAGAYIASMLATNTAYLRAVAVDRLSLGGLIGIAGPTTSSRATTAGCATSSTMQTMPRSSRSATPRRRCRRRCCCTAPPTGW